jgi:RNA polymerase sigma-70 factor (sigma-E family)
VRSSARDEEFAEFVAARRAYLGRIAYALCGDPVQAQDLLQTALMKLYVAWPRLHRDGREEAYVRQILVRANLDEHRRPWRRRESSGLDTHPEPVTPTGLAYEDRSALWDAVQSLPPMQRRSVLLRHWLGLSVIETADALGITEGTVKSHTSRGLAALERALSSGRTTSRGVP